MLFVHVFKTGPSHTTVYVSISIGVLVGIVLVVGLLRYFLFQKRDISLPPGTYLTRLEIFVEAMFVNLIEHGTGVFRH